MASLTIAAANPGAAHSRPASAEHFTVRPGKVNMLDCNAWSKSYTSAVPGFRKLCTDPRGPKKGYGWNTAAGGYGSKGRFVDNGHYVGHDEPSVKFISTAVGSGNTMTYFMTVPRDPSKPPTNNGTITKYAELTGAAWFGLPLCDPGSYPQNPCTPHSDANTGINQPTDAGSAFMELQFYAPGFIPFQDNTSCSTTQWCVAMTIDSLESQFNFVNLNPNCVEPVNFAYLQTNGVPAGPPSPQLANGHTFTPNAHTLKLNPGDVLKVAITDPLTGPDAGFTTAVTDMTTHQTGFITASAGNGFMNTNYKTCKGSPFTFHAEYNTARQQNQVPWAALQGGVLMEQEIGHNEVCSSLTHQDPLTAAGLQDNKVFDTCVGGNEHTGKTGEGSCNLSTGVCQHPTTEGTTGPIACPSNNFGSGQLCEYADGSCLPQGTRTITLNGVKVKATMPVNYCQANRFQNGDLDFDGISYQPTSWPNGSSSTPTSIRYAGPFGPGGNPYPQVQFESDAPGSAFLCNIFTGNLCQVPPLAAKFYPYWTLTSKAGQNVGEDLFPAGACIWNFGNTIKNVTTNNLGKQAQYGRPDVAIFGGTVISAVQPNPQIAGTCPALVQPGQ
jgi:hypothetical protein